MDTMLQTSDTGIQMTQSESEQQLQHIVADELDASCLQYGMEMKTIIVEKTPGKQYEVNVKGQHPNSCKQHTVKPQYYTQSHD